jgi:zinc transporter ZupT
MFGVYMTHIAPESLEMFKAYVTAKLEAGGGHAHRRAEEAHDDHGSETGVDVAHVPWTQFITLFGFCSFLFLDKFVAARLRGKGDHGGSGHSHGLALVVPSSTEPSETVHGHHHANHVHSHVVSIPVAHKEASSETNKASESVAVVAVASVDGADPSAPVADAAAEQAKLIAPTPVKNHLTIATTFRAVLFSMAMSIHAVFDGLAIGVQSSPARFNAILVAVLIHKAFDGVAVAGPVYAANLPWMSTAALIVFPALMTPLGIGIGIAVKQHTVESSDGHAHGTTGDGSAAEAILLALTGGTFLYISLMEMVPEALCNNKHVGKKIGAFVVGMMIMAALAIAPH